MLNPRLAGRYAKSLIDLAVERKELDTVYADMLYMQTLQRQSPEFVKIIKSPVMPGDKKNKILDALTKDKISVLTATFSRLLISKGREFYLPEIVDAFIQQYKDFEGIRTITLTTAVEVSDDVKNAIVSKVKTVDSLDKIELISKVDPAIIGGFVLEVGDQLVDASIAFDLANIKKQFANNDFIYNIR